MTEVNQTDSIHEYVKQNRDDIREIKDNHLYHIGADITSLKVDVNGVKTDVEWLKNNHWKVITTIVVSVIVSVIGVIVSTLK